MSDDTRTVRTTIQPDVDLVVGPAEYLDLKRQGLLVDDGDTDRGESDADKPARKQRADKQEG